MTNAAAILVSLGGGVVALLGTGCVASLDVLIDNLQSIRAAMTEETQQSPLALDPTE